MSNNLCPTISWRSCLDINDDLNKSTVWSHKLPRNPLTMAPPSPSTEPKALITFLPIRSTPMPNFRTFLPTNLATPMPRDANLPANDLPANLVSLVPLLSNIPLRISASLITILGCSNLVLPSSDK